MFFGIFANARYVPRMLSTVRFDMEDRGCFAVDERWCCSPRDRRCREPDQNHECMTKSLRDAGYSHCGILSWPSLPAEDDRQRSASRGRIGDLLCHDRASGDVAVHRFFAATWAQAPRTIDDLKGKKRTVTVDWNLTSLVMAWRPGNASFMFRSKGRRSGP